MYDEILQEIANHLYVLSGLAAGIIAFLGVHSGLCFGDLFWRRCEEGIE